MTERNDEPDIEAALASYMAEENIDREEALRDWLIGHGYLPLNEGGAILGGGDPFGI